MVSKTKRKEIPGKGKIGEIREKFNGKAYVRVVETDRNQMRKKRRVDDNQ